MADRTLTGKRALVTGGASGIGEAIVAELAGLGASVVIADRDFAGAKRVAGDCRGEAVEVDLGDDDSVEAALTAVLDGGGVDILINNAGVSVVEHFLDSDPAGWDRMWRINLRAPMRLTQAFLPGMMEGEWGRLIYISTDGARAGAGGESIYAACKAGLFGLAKTVAREAAKYGVTSNVVCPGLVDTPMLRKHAERNPNLMSALVKSIPLRRPGTADEVAAYVGFLAGPRAGYVTGQTLSVSGGVTMA
ncbi:SDR family NAD(P)-dependent oxidoreductase [Amycolatopsis thermoflava]|uniref:SDR family NAD(P)-dependent oxidoreductase n=1 Tax=Amycolatopsis thermoflava TaxID=84480 RepID=UPI0004855183|nr:SDR family NAD(P)-dependent oxidoreductase [Amycolatopsis thermoflava]